MTRHYVVIALAADGTEDATIVTRNDLALAVDLARTLARDLPEATIAYRCVAGGQDVLDGAERDALADAVATARHQGGGSNEA